MARVVEETSWYSMIAELSFLPFGLRHVVRMISWFFATLALAFVVPILFLIVYDFCLWIWRLCSTKPLVAMEPGTTIPTNPDIPGTSKSQISGAELEQVPALDKPASD